MALKDIADDGERRVARRVISSLLARGLFAKVFDGEQFACERTRDRQVLENAIADTDESVLLIYDNSLLVATIYFVWSLGAEECMSEAHGGELVEAIMHEALS